MLSLVAKKYLSTLSLISPSFKGDPTTFRIGALYSNKHLILGIKKQKDLCPKWHEEGEKNNAYFLGLMISNHSRLELNKVTDENRTTTDHKYLKVRAQTLQVCKANGHALLPSQVKERGKGERAPQLSTIYYCPPKSQMCGVTFHLATRDRFIRTT